MNRIMFRIFAIIKMFENYLFQTKNQATSYHNLCYYVIVLLFYSNGRNFIIKANTTYSEGFRYLCFDEKYYIHIESYHHMYWKLHDLSWIDYCKEVYGTSESYSSQYNDLNKNEINFYYRNTNTRVISINWFDLKTKPLLYGSGYEQHTNAYAYGYKSSITYPHNEWIQVSRFSSTFYNWNISINSDKVYDGEGYSSGFFGDNRKVPYGCWFMVSKGSGVYINIGRTFVLQRGGESLNILFQKYSNEMNYANHCIHGDRSKKCVDKYLCSAALSLGYDSVQIPFKNEVVICSRRCATELLNQTCPPLELRSGTKANKICYCSNESPMLNCDHSNSHRNSSSKMNDLSFITPTTTKATSLRVNRPSFVCITSSSSSLMKDSSHHNNKLFNLSLFFSFATSINQSQAILSKFVPSDYITPSQVISNYQALAIHLTVLPYNNDSDDRSTYLETFESVKVTIALWSNWKGKYTVMDLDNYRDNNTDTNLIYNLIASQRFTLFANNIKVSPINSILLELNHITDSLGASTSDYAATLQIGLIFYRQSNSLLIDSPPHESQSLLLRRIKDEAMCLRTTGGAKLVLLVQLVASAVGMNKNPTNNTNNTNNSNNTNYMYDDSRRWKDYYAHELNHNLSSYIDLILYMNEIRYDTHTNNNSSKDCNIETQLFVNNMNNNSYNKTVLPIFDTYSEHINIVTINRMLNQIIYDNKILEMASDSD